jgi:hypothetical protein
MKDTLQPGIRLKQSVTVSDALTVPALLPGAGELGVMPEVLASGFLIGILARRDSMSAWLQSDRLVGRIPSL